MTQIDKVLKNHDTSIKPIWIMRQAGRYLPEFREIRAKNPNFIELCLNEKLSTEITLQPLKRFDLDAAIIFSDILMIPYGLNQKVEFKKNFGPFLGDLNLEDILNTDEKDFTEKLSPWAWSGPWYGSCPRIITFTSSKSHKLNALNIRDLLGYIILFLLYSLYRKFFISDMYLFENSDSNKLSQPFGNLISLFNYLKKFFNLDLKIPTVSNEAIITFMTSPIIKGYTAWESNFPSSGQLKSNTDSQINAGM